MSKVNSSIFSVLLRSKYFFYITFALFFLTSVCSFWPGYMSPDSLYQYQQSLSGNFTDWHPAIMSKIWSFSNLIIQGPSGMLILQNAFLYSALLILSKNFNEMKEKYLLISIGLLPWILNISGVIWKDVQFAFSLLLLFSMLKLQRNRSWYFFFAVIVFYSIQLRHNGFIAFIPLFFMAIKYEAKNFKILTTVFISIVITLGAFTFSTKITNEIFSVKKTEMIYYGDDLTYFSLLEGRSLIPTVPLEHIKACALDSRGGFAGYAIDFCMRTITNRGDLDPKYVNNSLQKIWIQEIIQHPIAYLKLRLYMFNAILRAPGVEPYYVSNEGIVPNEFNIKASENFAVDARQALLRFVLTFFDFVYRYAFWLFIGLVQLIYLNTQKRLPHKDLQIALTSSGLLYLLPYFFLNATDYRYGFWTALSITVSIAISFIVRSFFHLPLKRSSLKLLILSTLFISFVLFNYSKLFTYDIGYLL